MNEMMGSPKVKTRNQPSVGVATSVNSLYNAAHVFQGNFSNGSYTTSTQGEQIVYTTKRANQRAKSNYCHHLKESYFYNGGEGPLLLNNVSPAGWTTEYRGHHANCCNAKSAVVTAVETALVKCKGGVLGGDGLGIMNAFFANRQPDLTTVSIPNFLLDISELTRLYETWRKRSQDFPRYIRTTKRKVTKSDVVNAIPENYIAYKFGWKPTVADLTDLITGVIGLRKKLADFESKLGQIYQTSGSVKLTYPTSVVGSIAYPSGSHSANYRATCQRKLTAYIAYAPQPLAVMGGMDAVLRGLLDSMGFELNPRIIWDAIPFSFVIDWFFNVGGFLSRFKIDALELPIHLIDSFLSYKEDTTIEWSWKRANDGTYTTVPNSTAARIDRKFFHRMPIYPDFASLAGLGWKMPSLNQAALGVSLAALLGGARTRIKL
jgi:hypothetical protein